MKRNFDEVREREEQRGDEWLYGAVETDLAAIPVAVRLQYLPQGVRQYNHLMDTNGCASRGPLNILETKLDYFYDHGMHPNLQKWFDDNGFRVNGKFALCDAFIEILSGTTKNGNSLKAPIDTIYRCGVIPAALIPLEDDMTWEEYMNPARVTKAHKDLGAQFLRRITFNYEQVPLSRFPEALADDLLDVALHGWPQPVNGVYPRTDEQINHVVAALNPNIDVFDNYEPFNKLLAKDYAFFPWGYSFSITAQNPFPDETVALFDVLQKYGLLAFFAAAWAKLFTVTSVEPVDAPVAQDLPPTATQQPEPTQPTQTSINPKLDDLCLAIRTYEGWSPNTRSWRTNNPGNCRYSSVGYAPQYLPVLKDKDGFAIFKDYATGWLYLKNLLRSRCSMHPYWTLEDLFREYAPSSDGNDPVKYAAFVAKQLGVTPTFRLKDIAV